jgi:GT2 family glycosyltransferase
MALISMCCYDTEENGRSKFTHRTLRSLSSTVNFDRHRLIVVDNGSCEETKRILEDRSICGMPFDVITLPENVGTARGLNKAWQLRKSGEHVLKIDNDVEIRQSGWLDTLEECLHRDTGIHYWITVDGVFRVRLKPLSADLPIRMGIVGLKRRDLDEWPLVDSGWAKSCLQPLPREKGQKWLAVEVVNHVIGTCQLYNSALLDKVGYLAQFGKYAFDDALMSFRARAAGFYSCFWPWTDIFHIDPGGDAYTEEKRRYAGERMAMYTKLKDEYATGKRSYYHGPDEDLENLV